MTPNSATRRDTRPDRYISQPSPDSIHEAGPEQERPTLDGDEQLANRDERAGIRAGSTLTQGDDREDAQDADEKEGALNETSGDVAERNGFVLSLEEREQHDGAADVADDEKQIEKRTEEDTGVASRAGDVVGVGQNRSVSEDGCNRRDERDEEQHANDECGAAWCVHRDFSC